MLRFFHRPLLIARLVAYEYFIKNKKSSTIEYKIKKIINDVSDEKIDDIIIWQSGLHTPKLCFNGFQATAIYLPKYEEMLIIFRGSELDDISDWYYNFTGIVSGENTSQLDSALKFINYLKKQLPNFDNIYKVAAGHSLGGHLAISTHLIKDVYQMIYTYNSALPQLKQLRKYDKKFNRHLENYFLEKDLDDALKLEDFAKNYYAKKSHHIYNYVRENDFIQSISMTVGTFLVGKTFKLPAVLPVFVDPKNYLTIEDTDELDKVFGGFYHYLNDKGITPNKIVENEDKIADEFANYVVDRIKTPIQNEILKWRSNKEDVTDIKTSYKTFKALYNYMLYLAHTGIIPNDILGYDSKETTVLYENIMLNNTVKSLKNLMKPLQQFYVLTKALLTLSKARELEDISGWVEVAKAHDITEFFSVLPKE